MSEPILVVDDDYTVHLHGRKFALASPIDFVPDFGELEFGYRPRSIRISFDVLETHHYPEDKPKRTWSSVMGLRKPS